MPEQDQFTQTAAYILTRMRDIEREARRFPGRIAQVTPGASFQIWREVEGTLTEYCNLVFKLAQMGDLAVSREPRAWDCYRSPESVEIRSSGRRERR